MTVQALVFNDGAGAEFLAGISCENGGAGRRQQRYWRPSLRPCPFWRCKRLELWCLRRNTAQALETTTVQALVTTTVPVAVQVLGNDGPRLVQTLLVTLSNAGVQ